jgi:PAS domain S-box-containing protein
LLYAAIPTSLLANLFGCIVAINMFTGVVNSYRLYTWVGVLLPVSILRFVQYLQFTKSVPLPQDNQRWYVRFRIGLLLLAFAIGCSGFLLFVYDDSNYQMLLALLVVCIASFATSALAPHLPIVVVFLLILFFPLVGTMFLLATEVTHYISWVVILLVIMLIISALGIHKSVNQGIRLNIEAAFREERLRDFKQRLTMFVQDTPLAVVEWTADKQISGWNPAAESIFGYSPVEASMLRPGDLDFGSQTPGLSTILDDVLGDKGHFHSIQENRRSNGMQALCEWINTPLVDAEDNIVGVLSLVQDVTQRITNERIKNELVSIVSHELRTPVTSIKASLGLLASGVLDDDREQTQEMLDTALNNTNRLHLLINDILDVDKLDSGKLEFRFTDTEINRLVSDVLTANEGYAQQHGVSVRLVEEPDNTVVRIDPNRIFQVLTNLLSNAIKFSEMGAEVTITLQQVGKRCRVEVINRGEVIPEADREKMFGKFFQRDSSTTRSKGGTGLGLYICQKILREHGTQLDFTSSAEQGTRFFFDLESATSPAI